MKNILFFSILLCSYGNAPACYDPASGELERYENCLEGAEQGQAAAQYELAIMYAKGNGVPIDAQAAEAWYLEAASHGYADAQYALGMIYEDRRPETTQNNAPTFSSIGGLSGLGQMDAQSSLGTNFDLCLEIGDGPIEAIKWYRLAAAQGHTDSQIRLGKIYEHGQGVPQDDMLAYMWFDIAAKQGREESLAYKNVIAARINPELIPEAQNLADAWLLEYR